VDDGKMVNNSVSPWQN